MIKNQPLNIKIIINCTFKNFKFNIYISINKNIKYFVIDSANVQYKKIICLYIKLICNYGILNILKYDYNYCLFNRNNKLKKCIENKYDNF